MSRSRKGQNRKTTTAAQLVVLPTVQPEIPKMVSFTTLYLSRLTERAYCNELTEMDRQVIGIVTGAVEFLRGAKSADPEQLADVMANFDARISEFRETVLGGF